MGSLSTISILANAKYNQLSEQYGDDPDKWRLAGAATLIGSDLAEGYNKWANASMKANSIEKRQHEIDSRADVSIANLAQRGDTVAAAQATAFIKSGVKLEGSALNVMSETIEKANDAQRILRRETDFELSQLKVEEALQRTKADFAPFETALNIAGSAALVGASGGGSIFGSSAPDTQSASNQTKLRQLEQFRTA